METYMRTASGQQVLRIDAAKRALAEVLGNLPQDTNVGVLALNTEIDGSNWIVPLGPPNPETWNQSISQLYAYGGTPLGEFLKAGADALVAARKQQVYGTYRLLIVTDGEANDESLVDAYLPQILSRGIILDVIGVDMQSDHSLATRVHSYRRADDDVALKEAISEVFAETSSSGQDSGADFELLQGLPDEFAVQAIEALTSVSNAPVDERNSSGGFSTYSSSSGSSGGFGLTFAGLFCCFAIVGLAGLVALLVVLSRTSNRRR